METHAPEGLGASATDAASPVRLKRGRGSRRPLLAGLAAVVVVVAGAVAVNKVVVNNPFTGESSAPVAASAGTTTAMVGEGPLSSQINTNGTLSYAGQEDGSPYAVINHANGVITALPVAGEVIKCGQAVYWVDGDPVMLLCGSRPFYRPLSQGSYGKDVQQLNNQLLALGYADDDDIDKDSKSFTWQTATALKKLQKHIGADKDGVLGLGAAVALPGPLRVGKVVARKGTRARQDSVIVQATTTRRQVEVELNAAQQIGVKVGNPVQVTLPDNTIADGKVSRIGTVADSTAESAQEATTPSGASNAVLPVYVTLKDPKVAGSLDQAPVQVQITIAGVEKALTVPVTALIGLAGGKYGVEKLDARGARRVVPVELGLFDNAEGIVQVTGDLAPGDRVVVPAT